MALLTSHNPVVPFHIWLGFDAVAFDLDGVFACMLVFF